MDNENIRKAGGWKLWALGCGGFLVVCLCGFAYLLSQMSSLTGKGVDKLHVQALSPDGKYMASAITLYGGATEGPPTTVIVIHDTAAPLVFRDQEAILNSDSSTGETHTVFGYVNEDNIPIVPLFAWESNRQLMIRSSEPDDQWKTKWRDVRIRYQSWESS